MSKVNQDLHAILRVLKHTLRARGFVYADLAKDIGVSEITVKRIFSGASVSMKHLLAICDFLHVPFLEIAALARNTESPEYVLSKKQDQFFASQPKLYAIFIDLYRRNPPQEVIKFWNLNEQSFFKFLRELEKLELIELLPRNGYRFKVSGPVKVPLNGQLRKVFFRQNVKFLDYVQKEIANPDCLIQTSEVLISKEHAKEFLDKIQSLTKKLRAQAFADETVLAANLKESVRFLFAYAPYKTDWRNEGT